MIHKTSCIIIDDEPEALKYLSSCLDKREDWKVLASCTSGKEAIRKIKEEQPDVIFLDIEMPGMTGLEVINHLEDFFPKVIFVTAFEEYAVQAFEINALDYILKPFNQERFFKSLDKVSSELRNQSSNYEIVKEILTQLEKKERAYPTKIPVKERYKTTMLDLQEIIVIEAFDNYLKLHTPSKLHLVKDTIRNIEHRLDPAKFVRVHRSFIVNINRIQAIEPLFHGEYAIYMTNGMELKLTRSHRHNLDKILNQ